MSNLKEGQTMEDDEKKEDEGQLTGCLGLARQGEPWPGFWEERKALNRKRKKSITVAVDLKNYVDYDK
jgi:hypothetical protein